MPAKDILSPPLPFAMGPRVAAAQQNGQVMRSVAQATETRDRGREQACRQAFGERYDACRRHAGAIKQHTLDRLDHYLERWIDRATANGIQVHFANDGAAANAICVGIARHADARLCVKGKSMVTEETELLHELQRVGVETLETDLGEFILQIDDDAPSHIVTPMIHKDRRATGRAFERVLGAPYSEDPATLTRIAREHMRRKYRDADLGISGANFLVADTGSLVICTNEGNADFCVAGPRVHVAFVGIEKVIPSLAHLPVFLKLLARSATAQPLTVYTTLIQGPKKPDEHDGPAEVHVILVDNGRTEILRAETRELLRCIRCGACLNACPVYRQVGGGHSYGAVYSGPIGAVITPLFKGLANYRDLPQASSLCGACYDACPVAIDIPKHLVRLRAELVRSRLARHAWLYRLWAKALLRPRLVALAGRVLRVVARLPFVRKRLPAPKAPSFRAWWRRR